MRGLELALPLAVQLTPSTGVPEHISGVRLGEVHGANRSTKGAENYRCLG